MKPHPILSTSFLSGYRNNPPLFFTLKSNFSFKSHGILSLSPVITSCSLSLPSAIFSLKPRSVIKFAPRLTRLLCSSVLAHQATATLNPELAALPDDLIQQGPKLVFRTTRREGAKTVFRWATRAASRDRIKGEKSQEIESISASAASRESVLSDLSLEELFRKQYIPHEGYKRVRFQNIDDGKYVCIEMLNVTSEQESNVWLTQVPMVSALRHNNLAQVLGYRVEGSTRVLAYESTMASLHDVLHGRKESAETLDWMQRVRIVVDAAKGLKYLHENDTLHGDIGSNIVFLSADLKPKIAYYYFFNHAGYLVRKIRQTRQDSINPGYYAPEILKSASGLSESSDVYSFGVLILELLSGTDPLDESMRMDYVRWATPKLSVGTVELLVDRKLKGKYPLKAVEKLASVAALCLQERDLFRPNMSIVVRELQSLLEPL